MELPVVTWNTDNHIFRIYREPTEDDTLIRYHTDDGTGTLTPSRRGGARSPAHHHSYILFDENDEINKTYKFVRSYTVEEAGVTVSKVKYREIADERHIAELDSKITALEATKLVTKGVVEEEQTGATGNGLMRKILFTDSDKTSTLWTNGIINLDKNIYETHLTIHCSNVNISTNHVSIEALIEDAADDSTSSITRLYVKDADRLVNGNVTDWAETRSFVLDLPYASNNVSFQITISGHTDNDLTIATDTAIYIFKT